MNSESGLILSKAVGSRISRLLATGSGALFLAAGAFKLFTAAPGTSTFLGPRAFELFLEQLAVPFPAFFALAVPLLEIAGGIGLIIRRGTRPLALLLACDMAAAILLVGAPRASVRIGETTVGGEAWRLPLEVTLLLAMLWLLVFPPQKSPSPITLEKPV